MEETAKDRVIESDALKANLIETAGNVVIRKDLQGLLEVVEKFSGLHATLEKLLFEVCHPFRNWKIILPQLRSFALKNISHYRTHELGPQALSLFAQLFFEALHDTTRDVTLLSQAVGAQMVWLDKMVSQFTGDDLQRFGEELNIIFGRIAEFDRSDRLIMMQIVQGQHPFTKIAKQLLVIAAQDGIDLISILWLDWFEPYSPDATITG